jgi:hypothetical protein
VEYHLASLSVIEDFRVAYSSWMYEINSADEVLYRIVVLRERAVVQTNGAHSDVDWSWRGNAELVGDRTVRSKPCIWN